MPHIFKSPALAHSIEHESYEEANQARLAASTWAMTQSAFLCSVLYFIYLMIVDFEHIAFALVVTLSIGLALLTLGLGANTIGSYLAYGSSLGTVLFLLQIYGYASNAHLLFGPLILSAFACFPSQQERIALVSLSVILLTMSLLGYFEWITEARNSDTQYVDIFFVCLTIILCYWITDDLLQVNREFRYRSRECVAQIEKRTQLLSLHRSRVQEQAKHLQEVNKTLSYELALGETMQRELRASNEQLEQFVYAASHDLKEPLRSIASFIQLIKRKAASEDDRDLIEYFDFVLGASNNMTQVLDGLLAYSRIGKLDADIESIDLDRLLVRVQFELRSKIEASSAVITCANSLGTVQSSKNALHDIFYHLIDNALKFKSPDADPQVQITLNSLPENRYLLEIRDNGIGIDADYQDKIFLLFQRLQLQDHYQGAGIGLALVRKYAIALGGEVGVRKNPDGVGSLFWVIFKAR